MRTALLLSLSLLLLPGTNIAQAQTTAVRRADIGVSFQAPTGYQKVPAAPKTFRVEKPDGSRITIRFVLEDKSAATLPKGTSATTFAKLHGGNEGKVLVNDDTPFQVAGAPTSVALLEYTEKGVTRQICHILALHQGRLYQMEYSAPTPLFRKGFVSFNKTMESVNWLPSATAKAKPAGTKPKTKGNSVTPMPTGPSFGGTTLVSGVLFKEIAVPRTGSSPLKLYVYIPESAQSASGLPCVLIAPAGSRMFHGMDLVKEDQDEEYPYAKAGFAVVAYEIDGPLKKDCTNAEAAVAGKAFVAAHGGVDDAKTALDYAIQYLRVDPNRIYTAGHSSAATVALQVAQNERRVKGCIAYAPVVDLEEDFGSKLGMYNRLIPGFREHIMQYSPQRRVNDLRCPLFLFQSKKDDVIDPGLNKAFAFQVQRRNVPVTFVEIPTGDHYHSMIEEGIPQGIAWLKKLANVP